MPKGVILEINGKHVIVLTKEGTFQRTFSPIGAQIGEEISYEKTVRTARPLTKWVSVAACLMLGVGVWAYWNISSENQVYAYVGIDINPSLELGINQSGKVLTVQALNDDAKALLADLSVQGESVDQAVANVAKAAASKGFVQQNADIVITASPAVNGHPAANSSDNQSAAAVDQNKKLSALEQNLVASAQKTFDSLSQNVHVDALQVSPQFHSAAAKLGLPVGKYAFYLKANSDGHPVSIDELKTTSINKLESDYGIPHDFLKGETVQSLDVALKNSDQSDKGSKNTTHDAPAKTDGNSQNAVSTKPSDQSDTNQQPGTYTKPGKKTVSGSSEADQHTNLFNIIKQKLHLTPQNKDYQDTQGKSDSQTNVPTISVPAKDQSSKAAANDDKTNTDNTKTDKSQSDKTHDETTGGASSINSGSGDEGTTAAGTTKANGSEAGDKSKNNQSDSHSSSDKTVKPIVKSSHTVNLNVGSHVYGNEKTSQHGGLLGALLNK